MRKLTIDEMKKIGASGEDYEGCKNDVCCIKYSFPDGGTGRVCGSYEWYLFNS